MNETYNPGLQTQPSVAFVTCAKLGGLTEDDALASAALQAMGFRVEAVAWDRPGHAWQRHAAVVLRSCWDYFHRPDEFLAWVDRVEAGSTLMLNPPAIIRSNYDKHYLRDLEVSGIPIAPTYWCDRRTSVNVAEVLERCGWDRAVIKPTVSGTSLHTWIASRATAATDADALNLLLQQRPMMMQKYLPEIEKGEWSLIFIEGRFSHAVVKHPVEGEFRVQNEFGGTVSPRIPSHAVKQQATAVLRQVDMDLLYARVDGVVVDGLFTLMELELIEPALFFAEDPEAARRFALALAARIRIAPADMLTRRTIASTPKRSA
ncbi:MAG: ATP-grasp domain-containing protein [Acidobacteriaceae bacterium]